MYGSEQIQREKADRTGVRKYRDPLGRMISDDVAELYGYSPEQMAVAFAFGNDVVDAAVNESVLVLRKLSF